MHMHMHTTSKRIELESPGWSGFEDTPKASYGADNIKCPVNYDLMVTRSSNRTKKITMIITLYRKNENMNGYSIKKENVRGALIRKIGHDATNGPRLWLSHRAPSQPTHH